MTQNISARIEREAQRRGVSTGFVRAERAQKMRHKMIGRSPERAMSKKMLVSLGVHFWPYTFAKAKDYEGAVEAFLNAITEFEERLPNEPLLQFPLWNMIEAVEIPDIHTQLFGAARWVDQGLPTVVLGERYASALMSTSVPPEMLEAVKPPWKAFLIEIPPIGLRLHSPSAEPDEIRRILVWVESQSENIPEEGWGYFTMCDDGPQTLWCINDKSQMSDKDIAIGSQWDDLPFGMPQDDRDQRIRTLIQRLILNTCLAMSDPSNLTAVGNVHKQAWAGPNEKWLRDPSFRHFRLGAPVTIDCRDDIRDYVEGTRRTWELGVQITVRGYWKMQHYGPKAALRKPIWIAPHKKGGEDAPVLIRPHHLQDPEV